MQAVAGEDRRPHVHVETGERRGLGQATDGVELRFGQGAPGLPQPSDPAFARRDLRAARERLGQADAFGEGEFAVRPMDEHRRLLGLEQLVGQLEHDGHHGPASGGREHLPHEIRHVGQGIVVVLRGGARAARACPEHPGRDQTDQDSGGHRRPRAHST